MLALYVWRGTEVTLYTVRCLVSGSGFTVISSSMNKPVTCGGLCAIMGGGLGQMLLYFGDTWRASTEICI